MECNQDIVIYNNHIIDAPCFVFFYRYMCNHDSAIADSILKVNIELIIKNSKFISKLFVLVQNKRTTVYRISRIMTALIHFLFIGTYFEYSCTFIICGSSSMDALNSYWWSMFCVIFDNPVYIITKVINWNGTIINKP